MQWRSKTVLFSVLTVLGMCALLFDSYLISIGSIYVRFKSPLNNNTRDKMRTFLSNSYPNNDWIDGRPSTNSYQIGAIQRSFWNRSSAIRVTSVDCAYLVSGDQFEVEKALDLMEQSKPLDIVPFFSLLKVTKDCESFKKRREYVTVPVTQEEAEFPIAFTIVVYKDFTQVERLLRAIYRPQNYYCIHYDQKSSSLFKQQVQDLVACFDNVAIASKTVLVKWGYFSVLQADLICMYDLLKYKSWKYLINLTGQEFPLKTNWQLVQILKAYRGANDISGSVKSRDEKRLTKKEPPPHNITIAKGPVHMAASRAFVEFLFQNQKARDFLSYVNGTQVPDETYFSTLQNNKQLGTPGAFGGSDELMEQKISMVRYKLWYYSRETCHGKRVRLICVFNVGDLPNLTSAKEIFANKFHKGYGQLAYDCIEEWHRNRTRDEYLGLYKFDASGYSRLPFVKFRTNINSSNENYP